MANDEKELDIPIWLKTNLTVEEAAAYTEEFLENAFSI